MRQVEVGIVIDHPLAQQAAPRAQWIQQFLANGVLDLRTSSATTISRHEAHSGDKAPSDANGLLQPECLYNVAR